MILEGLVLATYRELRSSLSILYLLCSYLYMHNSSRHVKLFGNRHLEYTQELGVFRASKLTETPLTLPRVDIPMWAGNGCFIPAERENSHLFNSTAFVSSPSMA